MKVAPVTMLLLQALLVFAHASFNTTTVAVPLLKLGKLASAAGNVINTLNPHEKSENRLRDFENNAFELDPSTVTPAIAPVELDSENLTSNRSHARHLSKRQCSMTKPWLCDGITCFNKFTHMCCRGGYTCGGCSFCAMNAAGQIFCRH